MLYDQPTRYTVKMPRVKHKTHEVGTCLAAFPVDCTGAALDGPAPSPLMMYPPNHTASVLVPTTTSVPATA